MHILMLETRRGSEDGKVVRMFRKDNIYYVMPNLAVYFIRAGWAVEAHCQ